MVVILQPMRVSRPASAGRTRPPRPSSARRERPASAGSTHQAPAGHAAELASFLPRERPASAGRERPSPGALDKQWLEHTLAAGLEQPASAGREEKHNDRPRWDRAPRFGKTTGSFHCMDESSNRCKQLEQSRPEPTLRAQALRVAPRRRTECQRFHAELWSGTLIRDEANCSVPAPLVKTMQAQWRDEARNGNRFVCIIETCQNCEGHATTTKHNPKSYLNYRNGTRKWIVDEYPFIHCVELRMPDSSFRLGAFEVYLLCPRAEDPSRSQLLLLHSKLMTRKWPNPEALLARLRVALPEIVPRVEGLLQRDYSRMEAEKALREAEEWGLGSWERVQELASRVGQVTQCLQQGRQGLQTGDKATIRDAVSKGKDLQIPDETVAEWREDLKTRNLVCFSMKHHAHRFRRNAEYAIAVRLVQNATVKPLRLATLTRAVEKARAAEMPEEDIEDVEYLLPQVSDTIDELETALQNCNLEGLAQALDDAMELGVVDERIDLCQRKVGDLASKLVIATDLNDLVELTVGLGEWRLPEEASGDTWSSPDFATIWDAETARQRLQDLVDKAEEHFAAGQWQALQSIVDQLASAHIDEALWQRWTSTLQREHNFTVIKAVSGAGAELKRKLHTMRLKAAMSATSIPVEQLEEAAVNAKT